MKRTIRSLVHSAPALAVAGACLTTLGCGTSEGSSFTPTAKPSVTGTVTSAESGPKSVVCGFHPQGESWEPEIYMLTAMNNKLRLYPELAAAVGMNEVSDCESARAFYQGLISFRVDHPYFDADQPLDPTPVELPSAPPPGEEDVEEEKIFNGTYDANHPNHPVVRLDFRFSTTKAGVTPHPFSGQLQHCSGTFIGKNWILTAAHCITPPAIDDCVRDGTPLIPDICKPIWNVYGTWNVRADIGQPRNYRAHAFIHPDWIGLNPIRNDLFIPQTRQETLDSASHDMALLYIPDTGSLPGDVEADRAMRLWIVQPDIFAPSLTFWGWGLPDRTLLRAQSPGGLIFANLPNQISAFTANPSDSLPCSGDSGGPLVRDVTIVDNAMNTRTVPALMGVASVGVHPCPTFGQPPPVGTEARWASVSAELKFLESRLRLHMGRKYECRKKKQTTGTVAEVGECWGTPCTGGGCMTGEICYQPGRDLQNRCETCGNAPGCGCIIGQCLKKF